MNEGKQRMHLLMLTADPALRTTFITLSNELGIETSPSSIPGLAGEALDRAKYEGVLLDFDTIADAHMVLRKAKQSSSNKNAIVLAIVTEQSEIARVLEDQAHFLLQRPIDQAEVRRTLQTAHDLMLSERRRYFRCAVSLPIELQRASGILQCFTINISNHGVAIQTPEPFQLGEQVDLALSLPEGVTVRASGVVIWDDKHGKCGLHFYCSSPEMRKKFDSWLDQEARIRMS